MSDLHRLPLLGHDLEPGWCRAVVYRNLAGHWTWMHRCQQGGYATGSCYDTQPEAYAKAAVHVEGCK